MTSTASETAYYGKFYIPPHAVKAARLRFPRFCEALTDAQIRKHIDDAVWAAQQKSAWLPSRKPGEFVAAVPTQNEGAMYPILAPSDRPGFGWAIVSVMNEEIRSSWTVYPPEMRDPRILISYRVNETEVFRRVASEDDIAEHIIAALEQGAPRDSIEVYRQAPYSITAKMKR
jgi:hypothetical protein